MMLGGAGTGRLDQATRLREMVRRPRRALTLAVTSGKGGVGKSNVAVNLSICLAARGLRVTLVDVDMGLANADLLMDIRPRYTLSHVLSGICGIEAVVTSGPGGIRFIPGASGAGDWANLSDFDRRNLVAQVQKLEDSADIVVLDCGAGIAKNVTAFAVAADHVTVVTTPEPTSITDAYATIKTLLREGFTGRLHLFVNRANSQAQAGETYRRVAGVAQRFLNYSVADHGYMLHDTTVELAVQARCPFVIRYPSSNASACMAAMAEEVALRGVGAVHQGGFLKRVAGLFL